VEVTEPGADAPTDPGPQRPDEDEDRRREWERIAALARRARLAVDDTGRSWISDPDER
jgi:hypothetical protein